MTRPAVYTMPADRPFARELARGILAADGNDPITLSRRLVLLPTRRACRAVRDAFLEETNGKPLLLPRLQPLGDVDAEELALAIGSDLEQAIAPAMPPLRRTLLLARLVAARESGGFQPERHIKLARALGRLMDQTYTEDLSLAALPQLVDGTDFAAHWQITVDFLTILSQEWPRILAAHGMIDAADRRNRLLKALATQWQAEPPAYPVLAAGSTGSIPATAQLLKIIARLPGGAVVLPGLDQYMQAADWDAVEEGHPQATLKHLLGVLECPRESVRPWRGAPQTAISARIRLASEMMRPAAGADAWQHLHWPKKEVECALRGLSLIETDGAQEEAEAIAVLLRETLESKGKTALLVTPDRSLARRVIAAMARWGVSLDDSAGRPLFQSGAAQFFLAVADMLASDLKPAYLLAALKSPLCCSPFSDGFAGRLEKDLLRGLAPAPGVGGLLDLLERKTRDPKERRKPDPSLRGDLKILKNILSPFYPVKAAGSLSFGALLKAHIDIAEKLSTPEQLWAGEDGQALSAFLSALYEETDRLERPDSGAYPLILRELMSGQTVRPAYGTHPRLAVMGQLEARLVQADRLILAGLNEGTWPPEISPDPFLSRPMKRDFGLPPPERAVGLAAHDFVQGFCAGEVYLTRARKAGGAPTIPARWLARLDTVLHALGRSLDAIRTPYVPACLAALGQTPPAVPVGRPAPRPDPALRPDRLSVTRIETWLKDPYSIYARYVLALEKLKPLEQEPDAAERGTLFHAILEDFVARTAGGETLSEALFLSIAKDKLPLYIPAEADRALLWPRIVRLAGWFVEKEREWRKTADPGVQEAHTSWTFQPGARPFTLSGIADRIDWLKSGGAAIIDYKTGGASTYTPGGIRAGKWPQLPLEALMLREGAFATSGIPVGKTGTLSYWIVTGGKTPGAIQSLADEAAIADAIRAAETALYDLVKTYEQAETPYFALPMPARAPRYNDYAHLARIQEWTALDEAEEAA